LHSTLYSAKLAETVFLPGFLVLALCKYLIQKTKIRAQSENLGVKTCRVALKNRPQVWLSFGLFIEPLFGYLIGFVSACFCCCFGCLFGHLFGFCLAVYLALLSCLSVSFWLLFRLRFCYFFGCISGFPFLTGYHLVYLAGYHFGCLAGFHTGCVE